MHLHIKNATIIDPRSPHNGEQLDLLIVDGIIQSIGKNISTKDAQVVDKEGLSVSIGWCDVGTQVGDPGFEHREDLETAAAAAKAGGYTAVASQPNTHPVVQSKTQVHYLKNNTADFATDFYAIGAVSENCEGKDITEMLDMQQAGAIAFSDGKHSIQDSGLMLRALQYVRAFNGLVINHPNDKLIAGSGKMHEGMLSTSLGMKGIPSLAEELMVQRDIYLAEYTNSRLHIANISAAGSVDLVRQAKAKGLEVTCSVAVMNVAFNEDKLAGFDPNYKVSPPLRSEDDRAALLAGLQDGTIDFIASNHTPWEVEAKELEFFYADFGAINLETTFSLARMYSGLSVEQLVDKLAIRPREILGLPLPKIAEGEKANLTLFQADERWIYTAKDKQSKARNSPVLGAELMGKVVGVVNG